jgi:hypothetical protein
MARCLKMRRHSLRIRRAVVVAPELNGCAGGREPGSNDRREWLYLAGAKR